jgi:hypothetical protein
MKKVKYLILLVAMAASFSSCVVRAHSGVYVRGHYEYGPDGGRRWVPAHYN